MVGLEISCLPHRIPIMINSVHTTTIKQRHILLPLIRNFTTECGNLVWRLSNNTQLDFPLTGVFFIELDQMDRTPSMYWHFPSYPCGSFCLSTLVTYRSDKMAVELLVSCGIMLHSTAKRHPTISFTHIWIRVSCIGFYLFCTFLWSFCNLKSKWFIFKMEIFSWNKTNQNDINPFSNWKCQCYYTISPGLPIQTTDKVR